MSAVEPLRLVTSVAAVLDQPNIDTDVIIRIERMVSTDPAALAPWAFEVLRYLPDGSQDPECALNQAPFDNAEILITGPNFGCGSSREPAVWAIKGLGVRAIIASSFGDIFKSNCHQNGILPVALADDDVRALATIALTGRQITVDLVAREIRGEDRTWPFGIGDTQRFTLLEGLDDLDLALREMDRIKSWEVSDRATRAWAWRSIQRTPEEHTSDPCRQPTPESP